MSAPPGYRLLLLFAAIAAALVCGALRAEPVDAMFGAPPPARQGPAPTPPAIVSPPPDDGLLPIPHRANGRTDAQSAGLALRPQLLPPETLPTPEPSAKPLPLDAPASAAGGYPALPPDPYAQQHERLPPLDEELWTHGGSYLYQPEGDRLNWPGCDEQAHYELLRLPEDWQKPEPVTMFSEFLGADPINVYPALHWPGARGYDWEPRFVAYGGYELFAFALEQNNTRQDAVGHQLLVDLDLQLTGTERFHVQFRPLGIENTGGSYYQFSNPEGYVDNSTGQPDRYWFEAELHSLLGGFVDPLAVLDYNIVGGRFPLALHNFLLMNDDVLGMVLSKNTIYLGPLSNLNVQWIFAVNDVDTYTAAPDGRMYGVHLSADHRRAFYEMTYALADQDADSSRDAHYAAFSRTQFCGPLAVAGRAMFKWGDDGGTGDGQLLVLETNWTRYFDHGYCGVEKGVFYCNAFLANDGWNSLGGGNFNRLRTAFEVDPLIRIAAGQVTDTAGLALGVQLFRHHEDESIIPEFAIEDRDGEPVWGMGLRYFRKTGPRTFVEVLGVLNLSDDPRFDREGVFATHTILF